MGRNAPVKEKGIRNMNNVSLQFIGYFKQVISFKFYSQKFWFILDFDADFSICTDFLPFCKWNKE